MAFDTEAIVALAIVGRESIHRVTRESTYVALVSLLFTRFSAPFITTAPR